ncbi:MAG: LysM peptidoglycan-binding domain-containing protein [Gammaproteobacteria bacterium]|nr:LysM peptidoglycan-binding domain-containing protein [Gammaproteobacteria bacterium]
MQNYSSVGSLAGMLITGDGALMKTWLTTTGRTNALRSFLIAALLGMAAGFVAAQSDGVELNPAHPDKYVVKRGDTLWDISGMFLQDPWYWPEIWYVNPQVENPHLIYPGDLLTLVYINGKPRVQLTRGGGTDRLSPSIRASNLDEAISTIPFNVIQPFLSGGMVMSKEEANSLPYIVALRDHMIAGAGNEVYVAGLDEAVPANTEYTVLRLDDELSDPDDGELLGYEVLVIGAAEMRTRGAAGEAATFFLTKTDREAYKGDLIRPTDLRLPMNFFPKAPARDVEGRIISVVDGVSRIGQYQMVIVNRGSVDGLEAGSVLSVWQAGETIRDTVGNLNSRKKINLPDTFAGNVMVVKAYEDIAYALVMEAVSEMRVLDKVRNP